MERNYNRTQDLEFLKPKNLGEKLSIDKTEFSDYIFQLRIEALDRSDKLESELNLGKLQDFNPDFLRLIGFGQLNTLLRLECEKFEKNYQTKNFYLSIKKFFLQLQEVLYLDKRVAEEDLDKYEK